MGAQPARTAASSAWAMCASSRQMRARITAEPTKANQNGAGTPQTRAMTPPSACDAPEPPPDEGGDHRRADEGEPERGGDAPDPGDDPAQRLPRDDPAEHADR